MNLKRIISIVTTLCMLTMSLIPGVIYAADAIDAIKATTAEVYDDLEGYTDVTVGSAISNLDGWSMSHTVTGKSGTLAKLKTATNPDNLCVKYNTDGSSYTTQGHITYAYYDFEAVSNDYILVSAKMNFNKQDRWIFLVNGEPSKNGEITTNNKNAVVELMIESGGKLCCEIRGNSPTWTEINTNTDNWTAGIWNDINILINSKAMTFDVYTNGVKRNSAPIPLSKTYVSNVGDRLGCVNRLSFGVMRQSNWGEMYIDDVTVNGLSEAELVAFDQTGLVVPDVITADTKLTASTPTFKFPINWTTDNANVQVGSDGTVVANSVANGKTVTLTAKVGDVTLGTYTATVNVATAIDTLFYEPFSYTLGQSISQTAAAANGWGVLAEDVIPAGQGSTSLVMADPTDSTNSVLDVETLTVQYTGTNRYAYVKGPFDANGRKYIMINTKVNITTSGNAYIFYINGDYKNSSTDAVTGTNRTMLQFTYDMPGGVLSHQDSSAYKTLSETGLALNKWTDMKFVIDTAAQTYNVYMDDVKLTQSPVALYSNYPGEYVSGINTITIGSNRWHRTSGHCYTDDLTVTAFDDAGIVELDLKEATVPETVGGDFTLPVTGVLGSSFSWASDNSIVTFNGGNATVDVPDSNTKVKLTLTATSESASKTKEFEITVLGDKDRIDGMGENLTTYVLSGQKYVIDSFTPNLTGLKADDMVEITCADSAVTYDANQNKVIITQANDDKIVDVKVKVTSKKGNSFEKTLKFYIPLPAVVGMYEDFNYPQLKSASISGADAWTITDEEPDLSKTGVAVYVEPSPDDETDLVMDTNVIRKRDPKVYGNQYATWKGTATLAGDAILQANIKFGDNAGNQYVWYNQGTVKTSGGESTKTLIQLFMNRGNGTLQSQLKDGVATISTTPLPTNEWFNMKVVIHATDNNFDVYINNVKQNAEPIPFYDVTEGGVVTAITQVQFGASRYTGIPGHMYVDDIMVRSNPADILATEAKVISVPSTLVYDFELPTEGIYDGTTISWKSSKPEVLSDKGVVTRQIGFGSTDVTLTATIKSGGATLEKDIVVKVVNAPYYTIDNVAFETSDGDVSYVPVNGGKLKNISVTKYTSATDDNATVFIAVYAKDGELLKAYEPKAVTASGNITYNEQLPIEDGMYAKAFIWNKSTYAPLAYSYSTIIEGEATIYTMGDSTMQTYATNEIRQQDNGITGWAQVLSIAADEKVTIDNHAVAGTSTRSFTNWGYIHPVYDGLKQGDYLVIQFGHNDEKPWDSQMAYDKYAPLEEEHWLESTPEVPEKYKNYKTYEQWLREYAAAARMKGAHVVFATSIYRRQFDGETPVNGHCGYPEAMIATAQELNAPVLDLHARTGEWLTKAGFDGSLKYFLAFHGGTDNTHLTYDGAVEVANLAIGEMNRIGLPLAQYFDEVPAR